MKKTRDKYSKAIQYLRAHPNLIINAWYAPHIAKGGCLFQFVNKCGTYKGGGGCLTMLRSESKAQNLQKFTKLYKKFPKLCEAIRTDNKMPKINSCTSIDASNLKHFARWQRVIDKLIRNREKAIDLA